MTVRKLQTDIDPRTDGTVRVDMLDGTEYVFSPDENGLLVCDVSYRHLHEIFKTDNFYPFGTPAGAEKHLRVRTPAEKQAILDAQRQGIKEKFYVVLAGLRQIKDNLITTRIAVVDAIAEAIQQSRFDDATMLDDVLVTNDAIAVNLDAAIAEFESRVAELQ